MNDRLSWNDYFQEITTLASKRSPCTRLQVGCILVKNNRIISTGYNGFLPGYEHKSIVENNHEQATVHAEQNVISDCAKRGVSTKDSICYVTHYPCLNCAKILVASGIQKIIYFEDYKRNPLVEKILQIEIKKNDT